VGRNISLDLIRMMLALMAVAVHATFLSDISATASFLATHGLFRIIVPLFLLISGYYFFNATRNGRFRGWIWHMFLLYLFWMAFYSSYWLQLSGSPLELLFDNLQKLLLGYHHLWYLAAALGAALVLAAVRHWPAAGLIAAVVVTFLAGLAVQYGGRYQLFGEGGAARILGFSWAYRNFLLFAFPYFCLGYLINQYQWQQRVSTELALAGTVLGSLLMIAEAWLSLRLLGERGILDTFVAQMIACPAMFLLALRLNIQGNSRHLASYAAGIFFIHPFLLSMTRDWLPVGGTALTVIIALLSAVAAWGLIYLNRYLRVIL